MFENFLNPLLDELAPRHMTIQYVRNSIDLMLTHEFAADGTRIVAVCQWPERECEAVYVVGPTGNVVRVRIDGVSAEKAEEFIRKEPNVEWW